MIVQHNTVGMSIGIVASFIVGAFLGQEILVSALDKKPEYFYTVVAICCVGFVGLLILGAYLGGRFL